MTTRRNVNVFTAVVCMTAALAITVGWSLSPIAFNQPLFVALVSFVALSLFGQHLSLRITEEGSSTTMNFVPQLATVVLLGPAGAGLIAVISWSTYQPLFTNKPTTKIVFNVGQASLAVSLAGLAYILAGAEPSLHEFSISEAALPFGAAIVTYFAANNVTVSYVISLAEERSFRDVWRQVSFTPLVFELAAGSLGLLIAYLYVRWGPIALFATMVPIIVLRYSYGVNLELRQLNSDLLRVLIKTIEAQDPYTSGHSIRVAEGALAIADELGLSPKKKRHIETAALLHDIGKIDAVYRTILRQEGPLTEEQRQLIRKHPERGVDLIESVRAIDDEVLDFVRHHHERYDGDGYPAGLKGEEIPLGARIIMVSDSIDAMITARPYRDALPQEVVIEELQNNRGTQFDPDLVDTAIDAGLVEKTEDALNAQNDAGTKTSETTSKKQGGLPTLF